MGQKKYLNRLSNGKVTSGGGPIYEVMKLKPTGECSILYLKRRDLIKTKYLHPRDLRRIDPQITQTKTLQGQTLLVKNLILIINIGCVKILCSSNKALLFEPNSLQSRRFLEILIPKLKYGIKRIPRMRRQYSNIIDDTIDRYYKSEKQNGPLLARSRGPQIFEIEMIESVLIVATGWLNSELVSVTRRLHQVLVKLPQYINPKNLEDLRKVKSSLVELESRADALRELLEELLEDELSEFNLSYKYSQKKIKEKDKDINKKYDNY